MKIKKQGEKRAAKMARDYFISFDWNFKSN